MALGTLLRLSAMLSLASVTAGLSAQITKGPWIQDLRPDSVVVMWETADEAPGQVEFGLNAGLGQTRTAESSAALQEVRLTNLQAGMEYHYRVVSGDRSTETYNFHTPDPNATTTRFCVYGDSLQNPEIHQQIGELMRARHPDFILHTGDIVFDATQRDSWDTLYFQPLRDVIASIPVYPAMGNHEASPEEDYFRYFSLPTEGSDTEAWYSFDWRNVHITSVNTNRPFGEATPQSAWLRTDLEAGREAADWLLVLQHHPAFSSGNYGGNPDVAANLVPLYDQAQVDTVFSGHEHGYERSVREGITYVTTSGGGAGIRPMGQHENMFSQVAIGDTYHYSVVELTQAENSAEFVHTLSCNTYDLNNNQIDSYHIVKREEKTQEDVPTGRVVVDLSWDVQESDLPELESNPRSLMVGYSNSPFSYIYAHSWPPSSWSTIPNATTGRAVAEMDEAPAGPLYVYAFVDLDRNRAMSHGEPFDIQAITMEPPETRLALSVHSPSDYYRRFGLHEQPQVLAFPTTAEIEFNVPEPARARVRWGLASADAEATRQTVDNEEVVLHRVPVTGLEPHQTYQYTVEYEASPQEYAHWTDGVFTTPPADVTTQVQFVIYGDSMVDYDQHRRLIERMLPLDFEFVMNTGDIIHGDSPQSSAADDMSQYRGVFDIIAPVVRRAAYFTARGNHDSELDEHLLAFQDPGESSHYALQWGPANIIVLDNWDYQIGSDQLTFLEQELIKAQRRGGFTIVALHDSPLHFVGWWNQYDSLMQVIQRHPVDMIVAGHWHGYSRISSQPWVQVIAGGGGAGLQSEESYPGLVPVHHFTHLTVDDHELHLVTHEVDGGIQDDFRIVHPRTPAERTELLAQMRTDLAQSPDHGFGEGYRAPLLVNLPPDDPLGDAIRTLNMARPSSTEEIEDALASLDAGHLSVSDAILIGRVSQLGMRSLGSYFGRQDQSREVIEVMDAAILMIPNVDDFHLAKHGAQLSLGEYEESLETAQRLAARSPENPMAMIAMGDSLLLLGRRADAMEQWHEALTFTGSPEAIVEAQARVDRQFAPGLDALPAAAQDAIMMLANAPDVSAEARWAPAMAALQPLNISLPDALALGRVSPLQATRIANWLVTQGRNAEALGVLDAALINQGGTADVQLNRADILLSMERPIPALAAAQIGLSVDRQSPRGHLLLARALLALELPENVREHLSLCLSHNARTPEEREIKTTAAQLMLQLLTQTHPELTPQQRAAVIALACISGTGAETQWAQARQILAQSDLTILAAMRLGSASHLQALRVAQWLMEQRAFDQSLQIFELADDLQANNPESHLGRAHALLALARFEEALAAAEAAHELAPQHAWAQIYLGDAKQALGRTDEAHTHWTNALSLSDEGARHEAQIRLGRSPVGASTP